MSRGPIVFYSKRQNSVDTLTFGSEFASMKQAVELLKGLWRKLRMFGTPANRPASMHCDDEAVCKSASMPKSVLSRKMHGASHHFCKEAFATDKVRAAKEDILTNLADPFAKVLDKVKRDDILKKFMC